MITIIPSEQRHGANHGWLNTKHSFSFADYYDPNNMHFGSLRVFNDDIVAAGRGFGRHPHNDMEIVSYVIDGTLEHSDSLGNTGKVQAGEVQRITAGTGIEHSEYNASSTEPVHFLQLWFMPTLRGLTPSWEQRVFTKEEQKNRLLPVVSSNSDLEALGINQDVTIYLSSLEAGNSVSHDVQSGRKAYLFVIKGEVSLNGEHSLKTGDSARMVDLDQVKLDSASGAELMLIDLV